MTQNENAPEFIRVPASDPEMQAAIVRARQAFLEFIRELQEDSKRLIPALSIAMIKAYFADADEPESGEHMWVDEVEWDGQFIEGILCSVPGHVTCVGSGDSVKVPLDRLSDWLYVLKGIAHGAFTVQVLRRRMSPEERREHDNHYPFAFPDE